VTTTTAASPAARRRRRPRFGLLEVPALLAILLVVAMHSLATEDLAFWDETAYMSSGYTAGQGGMSPFAYGATYSDLYWVLSHVVAGPIPLYFIGRAVAAGAFVLGVWAAARLLSGPRLAWAAAAVAAALPVTYLWPGVAGPASAAVIVGVALLLRWPGLGSLGAATGLFWLAAGSRPEFTWLAAACSVGALGWLVWSLRPRVGRAAVRIGPAIGVLAGAILLPAILVSLHGSPFADSGRDWVAFGQHYSLRHALPGEDSWLDWEAITARDFPGATGVLSAVTTNPSAFAGHVLANIRDTPNAIASEVLGLQPSQSPTGAVGVALLALLVAGVVVSLILSPTRSAQRLRGAWHAFLSPRYRPALLVGVGLLLLVVAPLAVIYPRPHYMVVPAAALLVGCVVVQRRIGSNRLTWVLPVLGVVVVFSAFGVRSAGALVEREYRPPALATAAQQLADDGRTWHLLAMDYGLEAFVPGLDRPVAPVQAGETMAEYLDRTGTNAALVNDRLAQGPWAALPGFAEFAADPAAFGFRPLAEGSHVWVRDGR
jgi:hypothetical protein